ncbi:MAG: glycosyltransferase [Alphaproteobacteria bacterium]|nr:glycosyltransferase [Alphaproteobacteria bacterium]
MKILYGMNGVGNGHISRARLLVPKLQAAGADVDCILSGRPAEDCPDLSALGDVKFRKGLSISFDNGSMNFFKNSTNLVRQFPNLIKEVATLDTRDYDLVISDFEPVSAWAAKLQGTPCIGTANHHALEFDVPRTSPYSPFMLFMRGILPADTKLPTHYDQFDQPILPPFKTDMDAGESDPKKILVYLNFENLESTASLLKDFKGHDFYIYNAEVEQASDEGNLHFRPLSKDGFKRDFQTCAGVITNAGFMTTAEALQMGKKILVKPAIGQKEQESNVIALEELGYATAMRELDSDIVSEWLRQNKAVKMTCPDTAQALVDWVMKGEWTDSSELVSDLWNQVERKTVYIAGNQNRSDPAPISDVA